MLDFVYYWSNLGLADVGRIFNGVVKCENIGRNTDGEDIWQC